MGKQVRGLDYTIENIGRMIKTSKKRFTWTFKIDSKDYVVVYTRSSMSGKDRIEVNEQMVFQKQEYVRSPINVTFQADDNILVLVEYADAFKLFINSKDFDDYLGHDRVKSILKKSKVDDEREKSKIDASGASGHSLLLGSSKLPTKPGRGNPAVTTTPSKANILKELKKEQKKRVHFNLDNNQNIDPDSILDEPDELNDPDAKYIEVKSVPINNGLPVNLSATAAQHQSAAQPRSGSQIQNDRHGTSTSVSQVPGSHKPMQLQVPGLMQGGQGMQQHHGHAQTNQSTIHGSHQPTHSQQDGEAANQGYSHNIHSSYQHNAGGQQPKVSLYDEKPKKDKTESYNIYESSILGESLVSELNTSGRLEYGKNKQIVNNPYQTPAKAQNPYMSNPLATSQLRSSNQQNNDASHRGQSPAPSISQQPVSNQQQPQGQERSSSLQIADRYQDNHNTLKSMIQERPGQQNSPGDGRRKAGLDLNLSYDPYRQTQPNSSRTLNRFDPLPNQNGSSPNLNPATNGIQMPNDSSPGKTGGPGLHKFVDLYSMQQRSASAAVKGQPAVSSSLGPSIGHGDKPFLGALLGKANAEQNTQNQPLSARGERTSNTDAALRSQLPIFDQISAAVAQSNGNAEVNTGQTANQPAQRNSQLSYGLANAQAQASAIRSNRNSQQLGPASQSQENDSYPSQQQVAADNLYAPQAQAALAQIPQPQLPQAQTAQPQHTQSYQQPVQATQQSNFLQGRDSYPNSLKMPTSSYQQSQPVANIYQAQNNGYGSASPYMNAPNNAYQPPQVQPQAQYQSQSNAGYQFQSNFQQPSAQNQAAPSSPLPQQSAFGYNSNYSLHSQNQVPLQNTAQQQGAYGSSSGLRGSANTFGQTASFANNLYNQQPMGSPVANNNQQAQSYQASGPYFSQAGYGQANTGAQGWPAANNYGQTGYANAQAQPHGGSAFGSGFSNHKYGQVQTQPYGQGHTQSVATNFGYGQQQQQAGGGQQSRYTSSAHNGQLTSTR